MRAYPRHCRVAGSRAADWCAAQRRQDGGTMTRTAPDREATRGAPGRGLTGRLALVAGAVAAVAALVIALSAVHLLPTLRNPFAESTSVRSQPVLLKSITALRR